MLAMSPSRCKPEIDQDLDMPTCCHDDWFTEYEDDAVFIVKNRFFHPALRLFREKVSRAGVARTREIASYLGQFENYFPDKLPFRRWLNAVSYREALRVLLQLEPIEMALGDLPQDARALVRWSYIDQLTEQEVARLLDLRTDNRLLFDRAEARRLMINAYKQLCAVILRRFRSADSDVSERFKDCSRTFPVPPTISGDFDIGLEQGVAS
jgi:hypothetical protein